MTHFSQKKFVFSMTNHELCERLEYKCYFIFLLLIKPFIIFKKKTSSLNQSQDANELLSCEGVNITLKSLLFRKFCSLNDISFHPNSKIFFTIKINKFNHSKTLYIKI
jgi:hypothetical protein